MTELPNKLWELIEAAKEDALSVADNPLYQLNMGTWHVLSATKTTCRLCLAGAVMANRLGASWGVDVFPSCYPEPIHSQLLALNEFRAGVYREALRGLYNIDSLPTEVIEFADFESVPALNGEVSKAGLEAFFDHPVTVDFIALLKKHDL